MNKIEKSVNIFKALGDLTRLRIVEAIFEDGMSVGEIAKSLNMTQSAISHQLKTLKDNDIVRSVRKGKEVHYYLSDEHVKEVVTQVFNHTSHC
ncbi:MAG: metalloregulator ArsR/SmtB family transcription factor [Bacilli bacterium]|nr:metalloregulator ArsR/SmtB family transcription factor [Bacilli bacterium]